MLATSLRSDDRTSYCSVWLAAFAAPPPFTKIGLRKNKGEKSAGGKIAITQRRTDGRTGPGKIFDFAAAADGGGRNRAETAPLPLLILQQQRQFVARSGRGLRMYVESSLHLKT